MKLANTNLIAIPSIGFSLDKLLQGRLFAYGDAQRYRLGVSHNLITVNRAKCDVSDYQRDGAMRIDGNYGSTPAYTSKNKGYWTVQPEVMEPQRSLAGAMWRYDQTDDNFRVAGKLWRFLSEDKKKLLNVEYIPIIYYFGHRLNCGYKQEILLQYTSDYDRLK